MLPSAHRRAVATACGLFVAIAGLLVACGGLPDSDAGLFGPDDLDAVVANVGEGAVAALAEIQSDPALQALLRIAGASLPEAPALVAQQTVEELPRGDFVYDPDTNTWSGDQSGGTVDVLRATWSSDSDTAVGEIDWDAPGATVTLTSPLDGAQREAPTDASATLALNGESAGALDHEATYATGEACGVAGPVDADPVATVLDGSIGTGPLDPLVAFEAVSYEILSPGATSQGTVTARTASAQQRLTWNVATAEDVPRSPTDCSIEYRQVSAFTADLSGRSVFQGVTHVFGLAVSLESIVWTGEATLTSFDVQGSLTLDLAPVVDFAGTFDDADGDGVPGENVLLSYADGSTESLEAFLRGVSVGDLVIGGALRAAGIRLR